MTPLSAAKLLDGRVMRIHLDPGGRVTGALYSEPMTWDGERETLDVVIPRDRMPPEDVEACEVTVAWHVSRLNMISARIWAPPEDET